MTDVTGFGLAGHGLEMARGASADLVIDWAKVPLLAEVRDLARAGNVTGASGRNWDSYGAQVVLPEGFDPVERALACDPQTSGGLLVACAPEIAGQVIAIFHAHGFQAAAVIGQVADALGAPRLHLR